MKKDLLERIDKELQKSPSVKKNQDDSPRQSPEK